MSIVSELKSAGYVAPFRIQQGVSLRQSTQPSKLEAEDAARLQGCDFTVHIGADAAQSGGLRLEGQLFKAADVAEQQRIETSLRQRSLARGRGAQAEAQQFGITAKADSGKLDVSISRHLCLPRRWGNHQAYLHIAQTSPAGKKSEVRIPLGVVERVHDGINLANLGMPGDTQEVKVGHGISHSGQPTTAIRFGDGPGFMIEYGEIYRISAKGT